MSKFCVHCGAEVGPTAKFCSKCGSKIKDKTENSGNLNSKKKIIAIIGIAVVVTILLTLFATVAMPKLKYNSAAKLLESGNYGEAKAAFAKMDGYKDSEEMIIKCDYNIAKSLFESGDYEEALSAFEALGHYSDSDYMINDCKYMLATEKMESGNYNDAIAAFEDILEHKDSEALITECEELICEEKYQNAVALFEAGKYDESIAAFEEIIDYKDSGEQIETVKKEQKYQDALALFAEEKYKEALAIFKEIKDYKDCEEKITECNSKIIVSSSTSSGKSSSKTFKVEYSATKVTQGVVEKEYRITCNRCGARRQITINFGKSGSSVTENIRCESCLIKGSVTFR